MGLYWRRSTKILPGVRINWSKNGPSISMGPKGAKVNIGKRGIYVSGGIPGTGLYYRQKWVEDQNQIVLQLLEQILQPMPLLRQHLDSQNRVALCSLLRL